MIKLFLVIPALFIVSVLSAQERPEGLFINSKAPDFKTFDQYGIEVRLKDVLKDSLIVLVFYRGYWDPYCTKFLKKLQDSVQLINNKGARLIAITPEKTQYLDKTIEKTKAEYSLLYDKENKIMKAYSVAFEVDEKTASRYKNADIDLATINNQKEKILLPVPAVYVISKEGTVLYRFFDADYKKRPTVQEILNNLK